MNKNDAYCCTYFLVAIGAILIIVVAVFVIIVGSADAQNEMPDSPYPLYAQYDCERPLRWLLAEWINPPRDAYPFQEGNTGHTYWQYIYGYGPPGVHYQNPFYFLGCRDYGLFSRSCTWGTYYIPPVSEMYHFSGYVCNATVTNCWYVVPEFYDVPCQYQIYLPLIRR